MLPSEDAVLLLLFGLLMSGQIRTRKMDGWQELPAIKRGGRPRSEDVHHAITRRLMTTGFFHNLTDTTGASP
jgi:hypothetical protein